MEFRLRLVIVLSRVLKTVTKNASINYSFMLLIRLVLVIGYLLIFLTSSTFDACLLVIEKLVSH
jgi:hypothetical protein